LHLTEVAEAAKSTSLLTEDISLA